MKTIQVSDEVFAEIEDARSRLDPSVAEAFVQLLLTLAYVSNPLWFETQWTEMKKLVPAKPIWEAWADAVENNAGPIRKTAGVMGGVACIGNSRIPVWALVSLKKQEMSDGDLLRTYPSLQSSDLEAAWGYYTVHSEEIDAVIKAQADEDELG